MARSSACLSASSFVFCDIEAVKSNLVGVPAPPCANAPVEVVLIPPTHFSAKRLPSDTYITLDTIGTCDTVVT